MMAARKQWRVSLAELAAFQAWPWWRPLSLTDQITDFRDVPS